MGSHRACPSVSGLAHSPRWPPGPPLPSPWISRQGCPPLLLRLSPLLTFRLPLGQSQPERAARASGAAGAAWPARKQRPWRGRDLPRIESSLRGRAALQTQVHPVKRQCRWATLARRRRGHSPPAPRPLASPQSLTTRDTWARRGCRSAGLAVWLLHQRTKRAIVGPFWTERKVPEDWRHARGWSPPRTPVPGATT